MLKRTMSLSQLATALVARKVPPKTLVRLILLNKNLTQPATASGAALVQLLTVESNISVKQMSKLRLI